MTRFYIFNDACFRIWYSKKTPLAVPVRGLLECASSFVQMRAYVSHILPEKIPDA